ncbi:MAG: type III-A CRISPR-associated protein Cas10/Csm1 [Syntrophomonadaceae bacterium]|nr:type III-A CRISPR-associated protein Cas10/Csm1 [Syntrophomonadaceae bacterium]
MLHNAVRNVTIGGLLHDIGKVLHRASNGDGRAHSISGQEWAAKYLSDGVVLDCIRYHHHQEIAEANLAPGHEAYVVYLADNIASGTDRRETEGEGSKGFDRSRPQESVYNLLNNSQASAAFKVAAINREINYPQELHGYNPGTDYDQIALGFSEGLRGINFKDEYVNSLLELTEAYLSYVPSSTFSGEVSDISLFDHSKVTAAVAACIVLYLQSQGRNDYRSELFQNSRTFYGEKVFCLFSCDISGVQPFIYTISSKGALKGLRARSFYLEMMLENLVDEILEDCSLYRANLIYTGGAHAYVLLPNTDEAKRRAGQAVRNTNSRLMELFGSKLFIAHGLQECCANELMNRTGDPEAYSNIFRSVSAQISERKLRRYRAADLRVLNQGNTDKDGRECRICGVSADLVEREEGTLCATCAAFAEISGMLIKPDSVFVVSAGKSQGPSLPVFSGQGEQLHFYTSREDKARNRLMVSPGEVMRIYSKNDFRTGLSLATKLWLGDYAATNPNGSLKTFAELAESSKGIPRLGVLRADVDNMGTAFVQGFLRRGDMEDKYRYLTLSRAATLSRSLSIFFKYYLNGILAAGNPSLLAPPGPRSIVVVYSGGDDLFLVGAWNEVLAAALDIRRAFTLYTGGALSISAGLAMFESGYPISRMAAETEALEKAAKNHVYADGTKNSISLLGMEWRGQGLQAYHTYDWPTFENQVLGEKYRTVDALFAANGDYGNSFLYNIIDLLRQDEDSGINIARLAYLLARREPGKESREDLRRAYASFSGSVYAWALDAEQRRQLLTAMIIYTYNNRE